MPLTSLPEFVKKRPRTRIVCTIGPATGTVEQIASLIGAGMSVARLNLSHGSRADHDRYVENVREASEQCGVAVGILADLPGPKYRVGEVGAGNLVLKEGQEWVLTSEEVVADSKRAMVWPSGLHRDVPVGGTILIDEGAAELTVESVSGSEIHCRVTIGGQVKPRKAVTAPGHISTLDYFTDETREALDFATSADVDFVGLSYIRDVSDLRRVRDVFEQAGKYPHLISKIELRQAVDALESILSESDGVMVARGDLGVEMPLAEVPSVQKRIIAMANRTGKPVITATQMLESMIESPHPTRAEASDVHNAVRDGTDAIMLSGETSIGKHPIRSVEYMAAIALKAEQAMDYGVLSERRQKWVADHGLAVDDAISHSAASVAESLNAKVILAFTESGSTAARVASYRPSVPILAAVRNEIATRRLCLRWGVVSVMVPSYQRIQEMFHQGSELAKATGYAKDNDLAVAVVGMPIGVPGNTNLLRVIRVPEPPPA